MTLLTSGRARTTDSGAPPTHQTCHSNVYFLSCATTEEMEPTKDDVERSGLSQSQSYYKSVLAQCETVEANVSDVQQHLSSLLEAVTGAGHSGMLLADALVRLFAETPLWSVAVRYKEKTESLSELASRTTSQVSQEVSSVLHKYTHLTPGTKSAVEGHQRSLRELDSARDRVDELGSTRNVERRRQAETLFERATEQYVQDDVRLVKAVQDIYDQKIEVVSFVTGGSCVCEAFVFGYLWVELYLVIVMHFLSLITSRCWLQPC